MVLRALNWLGPVLVGVVLAKSLADMYIVQTADSITNCLHWLLG
jgi:hypothetical protein